MFSTPQLNIFHMKFKNGYSISVSWIPGVTYSGNRRRPVSDCKVVADCSTAEVAVFDSKDRFVTAETLGEGEDIGYMTTDEVADLISKVSKL